MTPPETKRCTEMIRVVLSSAIVICSMMFFSCQKEKHQKQPENSLAAAAKEWYYSSFKKSAEWKQSPLHGKKLPDWGRSSYKKIGNMEIVEFPLVSALKTVLIPSWENLASADKKRIAEASLNKISFIKKPNQEMMVREISYVPSFQYLKDNSYDIGKTSLLNWKHNFTGQIIIRSWTGSFISASQLSNGEIIRKLKSGRKNDGSGLSNQAQKDGFCGGPNDLWECEVEIVCEVTTYSDGLQVYGNCETQQTDNCIPIYCEDPGTGLCGDLTSEECACQLYGLGCGEGSGGVGTEEEEGCNETNTKEGNIQADAILNGLTVSDQIQSISTNNVTNTHRIRTYKWDFLHAPNGTWTSHDRAVQTKGSDGLWRFTSLSHLGESSNAVYIGADVEVQVNNVVATVGQFHASMHFDAHVTTSLLFKTCPIKKTRIFNCGKYFTIDDGE